MFLPATNILKFSKVLHILIIYGFIIIIIIIIFILLLLLFLFYYYYYFYFIIIIIYSFIFETIVVVKCKGIEQELSTELRELKKKEINSNKREAAATLTKQSTKSVKQEF